MQSLNKEILQIAVPSIVSNVTVPLLGLVDTAITGHLGAAAYIAAIAVGTSIFSICYWVFSFLRMGTGGLTAQAFGRRSWGDCRECLRKALMIAFVAGMAIIALQTLIADAALWLMDADPEVEHWARLYFSVLVWGAPANLALTAMNGWLIGMQDARSPMVIAVGQNVLNIAASCFLVLELGWKVEGVAAGTLIAQWAGFGAACLLTARHFKETPTLLSADNADVSLSSAQPAEESTTATLDWRRFFTVNKDIFLRTVCLVAVMFSFTAFGSRQGEITLSVNALLMQMFLLVSYIMDGFAYAGEAIGGRFMGAADSAGFGALTRLLFTWGAALSVGFCVFFAAAGDSIVALLTDNAAVRTASADYLWVAVVIPLVSLAAFIYDGLFIGTTSTKEMLVSIATATTAYFAIALCTAGNQWLWTAFLVYLGLRGAVQHLLVKRIVNHKF